MKTQSNSKTIKTTTVSPSGRTIELPFLHWKLSKIAYNPEAFMVGKIVSRCHEGICWKTKTLGFFSHDFVKQEVQITMVELFQQGLDKNLFKSHIDYAVQDVLRIMLDL